MSPKELKTEIVELRMTEMEVREQLVAFLREVNDKRLWKEWGHASFAEFFARELGYDRMETREMMIRLGLILSTRDLQSEDPAAQERIEMLRDWRRARASRDGLAAYRVLTNRSLLEIAENNPTTLEGLQAIKGMGQKKCQAYGNEILGLLGARGVTASPIPFWMRGTGSSPSTSAHSP